MPGERSVEVGEELGRGGENIVYELGKDSVFKVPNLEDEKDAGVAEFMNSSIFNDRAREGQEGLRKYFGSYLSEEVFFRGVRDDGLEVNVRVQERLRGKTIQELEEEKKIDEVANYKNAEGKTVRQQGTDILMASSKMFLDLGVPVDVTGKNVMWVEATNELKLFDPGPLEAIYYLAIESDNLSEQLRTRLKKYYNFGRENLVNRLRNLSEQDQIRFLGETGMDIDRFEQHMKEAAEDPVGYIRRQKEKRE